MATSTKWGRERMTLPLLEGVTWVFGDTLYEHSSPKTVNVWRYSSDGQWVNFDCFTFGVDPDSLDEIDEAVRRHHRDSIEVDGRYSGRRTRSQLLYGLSRWLA